MQNVFPNNRWASSLVSLSSITLIVDWQWRGRGPYATSWSASSQGDSAKPFTPGTEELARETLFTDS